MMRTTWHRARHQLDAKRLFIELSAAVARCTSHVARGWIAFSHVLQLLGVGSCRSLLGAGVWLCPHAGFDPKRWALLCLFGATICGLITRPLPNGALVFVAVTTGALLGLFTLTDALSGFSNVTVWLIVAAFLFARGLVQTRLGERIAYSIIKRVGASPLRLGYAIVLADLAIAPMTPSNTARAGGILFPITLNVARAAGPNPAQLPVEWERS